MTAALLGASLFLSGFASVDVADTEAISPTTLTPILAALDSGISQSFISEAQAAQITPVSRTAAGIAAANPADDVSAPSIEDAVNDTSSLDEWLAANEQTWTSIDTLDMGWIMSAAVQLKANNNVDLLSSPELKWKIGLAIAQYDPSGEYRRLDNFAEYMGGNETSTYDHFERPDEEEQTESQKESYAKTEQLYTLLGKLIGLSDENVKAAYDIGLKWALGQTTTCNSDGSELSGTNELEKIYNWLQSNAEMTAEQASGVVANISAESGGIPWKAEIAGGSLNVKFGWGIVQWTNAPGSTEQTGRHSKVRDYVKEKLGDKFYTSQYSTPLATEALTAEEIDQLLSVQLDYMKQELSTSYQAVWDGIKSSSSPEDAAEIWVRQYERPREIEKAVTDRRKAAAAWYASHGGSGASSSTSSSSSTDSGSSSVQTCSGGGDTEVPTYVGDIAMPLAKLEISDQYGVRIHPLSGIRKFHYGMDYKAVIGTPVYAIADGTVKSAGALGTCGIAIEIYHNINGSQIGTRSCHLSQALVSAGDTVTKGQQIALSGNTGGSTGAHLHFEVRTSWSFAQDGSTAGNSVNPDEWLKAQGSSE
ncbi:phage tail tip lysozyme [Pseudoclavibacter soli]|uniref:phage tail tip lysozyme n=1 Tax=Pseudoclavibacter soli TaxID=452623 RepID=UPI00146F59DB|nr:phage tail tip lysozyme [Pseudoclavibacter soli]